MADKQSRGLEGLTMKIGVDVSEALTGLKALQREAKKATQAMRELETYYTDATSNERFYVKWKQSQDGECADIREVCMSDIPTEYLQRELELREGVTTYKLGGYGTYANLRMVSADGGDSVFIEGPAIVTVNID